MNLFHPNTESFTEVTLPGNAEKLFKSARMLFLDSKQNIWVGTLDDGALKITDKQLIQFTNNGSKNGLSQNVVKSLAEDKAGNIWIGTDGGGVNIIRSDKETILHIGYNPEKTNGLNSNAIYSLFTDNAGTVWVGTFNGGVNIYNAQKGNFAHYSNIPNNLRSLSNNSVLSILEDHNGAMWIGTDGGGLNLFDKKTKTFKHFKKDSANPSSISSDVVKSLYEDKQGNLWIGTYMGGLNLFDRKKNKFVKYIAGEGENGISGNIVWALYEDSRENLWISTLGSGLNLLNRKTGEFKHYVPFIGDGALGDYNIFSMLEDSEGNFWVGTEDHGLNLFNYKTEKFTYFKHDPADKNSISSNHVFVIFEDSKKNLWLGTAGGGLNLLDRKTMTFKAFTKKNGLPSNIICSINEDTKGNLWISTGKGISRFDPVKQVFRNFNKEDGLRGHEFNINALAKSESGNLFFGALNGVTELNPEEVSINRFIPPVVITDFKIFNESVDINQPNSPLDKPISETREITLSYKDAVFSFEFAALNFTSPNKNQYAFYMEGFDKKWNNSGNKREATYTNLDPGTYTFKVKGSNNDGFWNPVPATVKITIVPPWWKATWFRILAAVILIAGGVTGYKIRINNIRKNLQLEQVRELKMKEAQIREEQLKFEKAMMEMAKSKLESEVTLKNSKLASSVMNIVKQNEILLSIKENILETLKDKDENIQKKNLKKILKTIDQEVKPEQNWNEFEHLFNQLHENFLQKLKEQFPELTNRDLKLCAYLRMNLNSKEIAPLIGVSVRGVEDMRYRIRKKMGLDTSVNLAEFIISL